MHKHKQKNKQTRLSLNTFSAHATLSSCWNFLSFSIQINFRAKLRQSNFRLFLSSFLWCFYVFGLCKISKTKKFRTKSILDVFNDIRINSEWFPQSRMSRAAWTITTLTQLPFGYHFITQFSVLCGGCKAGNFESLIWGLHLLNWSLYFIWSLPVQRVK